MIAETNEKNVLSTAPVGRLMLKYAIPSVVALVVNALYNIVHLRSLWMNSSFSTVLSIGERRIMPTHRP